MARRTPPHLRKRPVPLTSRQRAYLVAELVEPHESWIAAGYELRSVRFWASKVGAYTLRAVYRARSAATTLTFVTKGAA